MPGPRTLGLSIHAQVRHFFNEPGFFRHSGGKCSFLSYVDEDSILHRRKHIFSTSCALLLEEGQVTTRDASCPPPPCALCRPGSTGSHSFSWVTRFDTAHKSSNFPACLVLCVVCFLPLSSVFLVVLHFCSHFKFSQLMFGTVLVGC